MGGAGALRRKILFVLNSDGIGGAERMVKEMCECCFLNSDILFLWKHPRGGGDYWKSMSNSFRGEILYALEDNFAIFRLIKIIVGCFRHIRDGRYRLIQTQLKGADMIVGILAIAGLLGDIPLVSRICNSYDYYYGGSLLNRILGFVHRFILQKAFLRVILVSGFDLDRFRAVFGDKVVVIDNGVRIDIIPQSYMAKSKKLSDKKVVKVAMVGNVYFRKGYDRLIELFPLLEKGDRFYVFNVAGRIDDEDLKARVESAFKRYKNVRVNFHGFVSDVISFVLKNDLFLSLSRMEGLPVSVLEAMACGVPVVLSDIPAHRYIVGESALIPLFQDVRQLIEKLNWVLQEFNYIAVVEDQFKILKSRFDFYRMCERYLHVYDSLS